MKATNDCSIVEIKLSNLRSNKLNKNNNNSNDLSNNSFYFVYFDFLAGKVTIEKGAN